MSTKRKQRGLEKDRVVFPVAENLSEMPENYLPFFTDLQKYIKREKLNAILNANQRMILMYWHLGNSILEKQQKEGWGSKVIDRLSHDLKEAFPEETGFSPRNLLMMKNDKALGNNIQNEEHRNRNLKVTRLLSLSMTKEFGSTTSNIIGTDLSVYRVMSKHQFAFQEAELPESAILEMSGGMKVSLFKSIDYSIGLVGGQDGGQDGGQVGGQVGR